MEEMEGHAPPERRSDNDSELWWHMRNGTDLDVLVNLFRIKWPPSEKFLGGWRPNIWKLCTTSSIGRSMDTIRTRNSESQDKLYALYRARLNVRSSNTPCDGKMLMWNSRNLNKIKAVPGNDDKARLKAKTDNSYSS